MGGPKRHAMLVQVRMLVASGVVALSATVGPLRPALRDAPQRDDGSTRLPSSRLHQDLGEGSAGGGAVEGRQRQALALHLRDGAHERGGAAGGLALVDAKGEMETAGIARPVGVAGWTACRAGGWGAGDGPPVAHAELDETVVRRSTAAARHQPGEGAGCQAERHGDARAGDGPRTVVETAPLPCDHTRPSPPRSVRTVKTALAGSGPGRQ